MITNLYKDENCNAIVYFDNNTKIEVSTDQIFDKNLHYWKDWNCYVGVNSIAIDNDYTVYAGNCRNDNLGNLFDENFALFTSPTKCKQEKCTSCTTDLFSTKFKG